MDDDKLMIFVKDLSTNVRNDGRVREERSGLVSKNQLILSF